MINCLPQPTVISTLLLAGQGYAVVIQAECLTDEAAAVPGGTRFTYADRAGLDVLPR
jgi:hypothetical protein